MQHTFIRGALFAALAFAGTAFASDTVDLRIGASGSEHLLEVDLDALAVGASLQLATKAGVPAIVSRSETGLDIEIAGKTTHVPLRAAHDMLSVDAAGTASTFRFIELGGDSAKELDLADGHGRIVLIRRDGDQGGHTAFDDARLAELLAEIEARTGAVVSDGEHVILTRKVLRDAEAAR